ncbi:MAG: LON peptidase substrate-binding domain-containing protein [Bacteriovoracaceae bacterium]
MDTKVFLFPLANSILFKKVTLPYHIFEPQFRQMVKDSITEQVPIAIVPYDAYENYRGDICVAGMPHILSTYPDGQLDIYITGAMKCRLIDSLSDRPYKVYSYKLIEEDLHVDESFSMELDSLKIMLERWAIHFLPDPIQRDNFSHTLEDAELLINYCTVFLVDDLSTKKAVMEANTLKEKINLILHMIGPKEVSLGPFLPSLKF